MTDKKKRELCDEELSQVDGGGGFNQASPLAAQENQAQPQVNLVGNAVGLNANNPLKKNSANKLNPKKTKINAM